MSTSVEFKPPEPESVDYVIRNMRQADVVEVLASGAASARDAVEQGLRRSHFSSVAFVNGTPCAVFGLVKEDLLTGAGCPWLLGTPLIEKYQRAFVKHTRSGVKQMLSICPILSNYVHIDHVQSIRWLKSMGFQFDKPEPVGVNGELFTRFYLEK